MGDRQYTITTETTDLEFQLLQNQQPFDASSVRQVVIYPSYADAVAETNAIEIILSYNITHESTGLYSYTASIIATAGTYYDKIFLTTTLGSLETTFINAFVVTQYTSGVLVVDVRNFLENYCITSDIVSNDWINNRINNFIIPYVERITGLSINLIASVTEYYSGNGRNIMVLNRRPIVAVTEIRYVLGGNNLTILNLANIETVNAEGVLKAKRNYEEAYYLPVFAKGDYNIKVTYSYGYATMPEDIKEAVIYLSAEQTLGFAGSQTGGGSVSVQSYSRNYGARGKFQDERNDLARQAHAILSKYGSGVVGN